MVMRAQFHGACRVAASSSSASAVPTSCRNEEEQQHHEHYMSSSSMVRRHRVPAMDETKTAPSSVNSVPKRRIKRTSTTRRTRRKSPPTSLATKFLRHFSLWRNLGGTPTILLIGNLSGIFLWLSACLWVGSKIHRDHPTTSSVGGTMTIGPSTAFFLYHEDHTRLHPIGFADEKLHSNSKTLVLRGSRSTSAEDDDEIGTDDDEMGDDDEYTLQENKNLKNSLQRLSSSNRVLPITWPLAYGVSRELLQAKHHDFGGLEIPSSTWNGTPHSGRDDINHSADEVAVEDEGYSLALDDDYQLALSSTVEEENNDEDEDDSDSHHCRRIAEHRLSFPTCNELHQLDHAAGNVLESGYGFINDGYFRDVFSYNHSYPVLGVARDHHDQVAIKQIHYEDTEEDPQVYYEYVRMDAIVAERLTSSPRIYDIYGYCGLSILSEFFHHGDIQERTMNEEDYGFMDPSDLDDAQSIQPQNDLEPKQKLVVALEMAQSLADLHGHAGGLIIHDDIQMTQFLLDKDKTAVKLNDFNRAVIPLWNDARNEYCKYQNGRGQGFWRSPEEYRDQPLTEAIDIWSLGNNFYGLLTGLNPLYDTADGDSDLVSLRIVKGETGFLDPRYAQRSQEEKVLGKVIKQCWEYDPADRPTIFEIVDELQVAVHNLLESKGISRSSVLESL